jgi:hypothetical protein
MSKTGHFKKLKTLGLRIKSLQLKPNKPNRDLNFKLAKFHQILEQLGQFENQIPIGLHHVICKLRTFIEGVDGKICECSKN